MGEHMDQQSLARSLLSPLSPGLAATGAVILVVGSVVALLGGPVVVMALLGPFALTHLGIVVGRLRGSLGRNVLAILGAAEVAVGLGSLLAMPQPSGVAGGPREAMGGMLPALLVGLSGVTAVASAILEGRSGR